jgi:putative addiction module component (TIGR02574 family)
LVILAFVMTLAALKKEVLRLPLNQRLKLAEAVYESVSSAPKPLTFEELEKRADEALSGTVKMIPAEQFHREARALVKKIGLRRKKAQSRSSQRG